MRTTSAHIWMHDGRSLCDRRADAQPRSRTTATLSDEELKAFFDEQRDQPACGSCLLVAGHVRRLATRLLAQSDGQVHPTAPSIGWAQLRDTRWAGRIDLEGLLAQPDLDTAMQYDAVVDRDDPYAAEICRDPWLRSPTW